METTVLYGGYIGIMEKKLETTINPSIADLREPLQGPGGSGSILGAHI